MNHKITLLLGLFILFSMSVSANIYTYDGSGTSCMVINETIDHQPTFDSEDQCENFLENCNSLFLAQTSENCPQDVGLLGIIIQSFFDLFPSLF